MYARLIIVLGLAISLSACAPKPQQHQLSLAELQSFNISKVDVSTTTASNINWPVKAKEIEGDKAVKSAYVSEEMVKAIKHSYGQELVPLLDGKRKVRVHAQINSVNILSDEERAAQIAIAGVIGGVGGLLGAATAPKTVGMNVDVALMDDKSGATLASTRVISVVVQEGSRDPGYNLAQQSATDVKKWLLTVSK